MRVALVLKKQKIIVANKNRFANDTLEFGSKDTFSTVEIIYFNKVQRFATQTVLCFIVLWRW